MLLAMIFPRVLPQPRISNVEMRWPRKVELDDHVSGSRHPGVIGKMYEVLEDEPYHDARARTNKPVRMLRHKDDVTVVVRPDKAVGVS